MFALNVLKKKTNISEAWGAERQAVRIWVPKTAHKNNFFCMKGKFFTLSGNILSLI